MRPVSLLRARSRCTEAKCSLRVRELDELKFIILEVVRLQPRALLHEARILFLASK
jgi:hypothetical protein